MVDIFTLCCHGWSLDGVGVEKYLSVKNLSLAPLPVNETSQTYSEYQSLRLNILYAASTKKFSNIVCIE